MEEVRCDFKYSGAGRAFLAGATVATLLMLAVAPFPLEAALAAAGGVIALALHARRALRAVSGVRLDCERAIAVRTGGAWRSGVVREGCFVAPWLTLVRWRPDGARHDRTLVILPDMLPAEAMRKIRVILKWA